MLISLDLFFLLCEADPTPDQILDTPLTMFALSTICFIKVEDLHLHNKVTESTNNNKPGLN